MNNIPKIFDSHFHIIETQFPLIPNDNFLPETFTVKDYLQRTKSLNIIGGAVISGSFQAFDQTYLLHALKTLGPSFVGVTQLPFSVTNDEILQLNSAGIRGVRFNLERGDSVSINTLESFAMRVYEIAKWHIELHINSTELYPLSKLLPNLPSVSIDHLGLSKRGFPLLLSLVEKGVKVKATGFSRIDFDLKTAIKDLIKANYKNILFGTDLPSTRATRPFANEDIYLLLETLDPNMFDNIFYKNSLEFYRIPSKPTAMPNKKNSKNN